MRVLMLGWELPPYNSGGLGVACYQLCQALSRKGVDIEFILPYAAPHKADFMTVTGAQPANVKEVRRAGTAYDSQRYVFTDGHSEHITIYQQQNLYQHSIAKLVEDREFEIIHAHDWLTFRAALRAKEARNVPFIAHVHSIENDRAAGLGGNPMVREIEAEAFLLADQIVAVSELTKRAIQREYKVPFSKIDVVYNSFDRTLLEVPQPGNAYQYLQTMKAQGYTVTASIGRLTAQKGLPNLLKSFRMVVDRLPKSLLLMVGSGEQQYELITQAAELGLSRNVIFTDFQRGQRYRDAYSIADLFVLPSVSEPFGLTPLEAIGYGTPALISKQSGVSEIIKNSLKVDFWDVSEMANQMVAVLRSTSLRNELLVNATKEFNQLSWNRAADQLTRLYEQHLQLVGTS